VTEDRQATTTVEAKGPGRWLVRTSRSAEGEAAEGTVLLRSDRPPGSPPAHLRLAGARAWLALGQRFQSRSRWQEAIASARAGLAEIGSDYAGPDVDDETDLKLLAAEDRLAQGHASDAAAVMLRVLGDRLSLYASLHHQDVVE